MRVMINTLPSKGYGKPNIDYIDIEPLTFREIRKYTSKSFEPGSIDQLIWDIECLIQDIDGWQSLSSFDISSIIFTRKYISATFEDNIKVKLGDNTYTIPMSDVNFKDLSSELTKVSKILLNGHVYIFNIPTIEQYYNVLKSISQGAISIDRGDVDLDVVYLSSCLININNDDLKSKKIKSYATLKRMNYSDMTNLVQNFVKSFNDINNCIQGDIPLINRILHLLTDKTHDVTVLIDGGETAVNLDKIIADIFRLIEVNEGDSSSKIIYS